MGALDYAVIGGTALAEYGASRGTADIDVMVPEDISEVVEQQLESNGVLRTDRGGFGLLASDGRCYGLDITSDRAVSQHLNGREDTNRLPGSRARIIKLPQLLNSKAWAWMTRAGQDAVAKKTSDAEDIIFILQTLLSRNIAVSNRECRWVVDYDFWTEFTGTYAGVEQLLIRVGLTRDATPSASNRSSRSRRSIRS